MQSFHEAAARLLAIDELQDDLLRQLDELERRTEAVLSECLASTPGVVTATAPQVVAKSRTQLREAA